MSNICPATLIPKIFAGFVLGCCLVFIPPVVQSASANSATLQWAANSESDLAGYKVYQGTTAGSYGPAIDAGNGTTYIASNLQPGLTYYFAVTAHDTSGNESPPSDEVSRYIVDSSLDVTPPSISLTSPASGATLSDPVTITATATDNIGVVGVQFQLNGTDLGAEDTTNSFSVSWDTTGVAPGQYTLTAIARDAAGNTTSSDPVQVTLASSSSSTLSVSVVGNGSVTSSPAGIQCTSGTCSASYDASSTVALAAKAGKRWKFAGWSGACSGTGECVIQLATDQFVGATFSKNSNGAGNGRGKKK
jgi:hypothetical protein